MAACLSHSVRAWVPAAVLQRQAAAPAGIVFGCLLSSLLPMLLHVACAWLCQLRTAAYCDEAVVFDSLLLCTL
jgi:hypothetical protein